MFLGRKHVLHVVNIATMHLLSLSQPSHNNIMMFLLCAPQYIYQLCIVQNSPQIMLLHFVACRCSYSISLVGLCRAELMVCAYILGVHAVDYLTQNHITLMVVRFYTLNHSNPPAFFQDMNNNSIHLRSRIPDSVKILISMCVCTKKFPCIHTFTAIGTYFVAF